MTSNGVGTCGADDNQAQANHLIVQPMAIRGREGGAEVELANAGDPYFALRTNATHTTVSITEQQQTTVRRLTELECERLQGYPDGWTDGQTGSARYRQLGNSVAVPVVEWIAHRLVNTHNHLQGDQ